MHQPGRSIVCMLARRFRIRAVELEKPCFISLHVLRCRRPGRIRLFNFDRVVWVLLYRMRPQWLEVIVLVKPANVVQALPRTKDALGE